MFAAALLLGLVGRLEIAHAESCANQSAREQSHATGLPDCRAYEQVTPTQKNGNEAGVEITSAHGNVPLPEYSIARSDGESLLFGSAHEAISGALGETKGGINYFWVSSRSPTGWATRAALPPGNREQANLKGNAVQLELPTPILPSANQQDFAVEMQDAFGPIAAQAEKEEQRVTQHGWVLSPDGTTTDWISQPRIAHPVGPLNEGTGGETVRLSGGSTDLKTMYFAYSGTLVPEDEEKDPAVENLSRADVVAAESSSSVGFYEWREGTLKSAGVLPDKTVDPYGAVPAATREFNAFGVGPIDYANNQISDDGTRAVFLSPQPGSNAPASDPVELYLRESSSGGSARSVLVSKSEITGEPASSPPLRIPGFAPEHATSNGITYAFAAPDGSRVFFDDLQQLTADAPNDESVKQYEYDVASETVRYLPGVAGDAEGAENNKSTIVGSTSDGSRFLFVRSTPEGHELDLWHGSVTVVTQLPRPEERELGVAPVRVNRAGTTFVFETSSPLPGGFNNGGPFEQIYRYESETGSVSCISCPPPGIAPSGDARLSNDITQPEVLDSRGVANEGDRVFFDTPDPLWVGDRNGRRDVYEWEDGAVHPVTPGTSPSDSFLLDNSPDGRDVFIATREAFVGSDSDGGFDIYDAREGGGMASPAAGSQCESECRGAVGGAPPLTSGLASETFAGEGNLALVPAKGTGKKAPSRKTLLRSALRRCRAKHGHRRTHCEAAARKRYGVAKAKRRKG